MRTRPRPGNGQSRSRRAGKLPFWKGDTVGRPMELGRAIGAFSGELEANLARGGPVAGRPATAQLREHARPRRAAADNLLAYER